MPQTTYQAALGTIKGMCKLPTEMPHLALVKRIEAISLIVDGAMCNDIAQDTPTDSKPATMPKMDAFEAFWASLKPDYQAYLLSVFTTAGKGKYQPDEIPVGPDNIGGFHKAINGRAKKAKVKVLGDSGTNGNRRWFLTPAFHAYMEHKALQPA